MFYTRSRWASLFGLALCLVGSLGCGASEPASRQATVDTQTTASDVDNDTAAGPTADAGMADGLSPEPTDAALSDTEPVSDTGDIDADAGSPAADSAVGDIVVTDAASQDTAPQDTAPQDTAPQDTAPQDTAPQDTAPQDTTPQDTVSQDTVSQDTGAADASAPPCKSDLSSTAQTPSDSKTVDFEGCSGCSCCTSSGAYPAAMSLACLQCGPKTALATVGGTLQGGMLTGMVSCIKGNAAAPVSGKALFVGGGLLGPNGKPVLIIDFKPPVTIFGFSGLATASTSQPHVVLRGYDAAGALIAEDAFDFTGKPGGSCATTNPAAQFFGFRPCGDTAMARVVLETSDANLAIDNVRVWRP